MAEKTKRVLTNTGKQFYTWETIGSFAGATGVVVLIWNVLKHISPDTFVSEIVPFGASFFVMIAFALLTEPPKKVEPTTWRQKGQKMVITIVNSFLVYSAALGFNSTVT